jgi:hypothetical protein
MDGNIQITDSRKLKNLRLIHKRGRKSLKAANSTSRRRILIAATGIFLGSLIIIGLLIWALISFVA